MRAIAVSDLGIVASVPFGLPFPVHCVFIG